MADPVTALYVVAAIGAGTAVYTSDQQRKAMHAGQDQQRKQMAEQEEQAKRDFNRTNQKAPNVEAIMAANRTGGSGIGTLLTGQNSASGASLGQTTLLGQ